MKYLDSNRKIKPSLIKFLKENQDLVKEGNFEELYDKLNKSGWQSGRDLTYLLSNKGKRNIFEYFTSKIPFAACSYDIGLYEVTIPDNIEIIEDSAFNGCSQITKLVLPSSVHTIESWALADMDNLEELTIKGELIAMNDLSIYNVPKLDTIYSLAENRDLLYDSVDCLKKGFCRFLVI
ncbi:MAG: leucine-rich repeat protein [Acholeplasmatales bacterium]|nr:leucine-rich repeat protein [Acholeplasmatales bacterium]